MTDTKNKEVYIKPTRNGKAFAKNEIVVGEVKNYFNKLSRIKSSKLITLIVTAKENNMKILSLKGLQLTENILKNNTKRIALVDGVPILKEEFFDELYLIILDQISKSNSSNIEEIEDDDSEAWLGKDIDDKSVVSKDTTYRKILRHTEINGEHQDYLFNFIKNDKPEIYDCFKNTLQVIEVDISSSGYLASMPIKFVYNCDKCKQRGKETHHERYPSDVDSVSGNSINCNSITSDIDAKKIKFCGSLLKPSEGLSKTKPIYIYNATIKMYKGKEAYTESYKIISYKYIPVGPLTAAIVKYPTDKMLFLVDYKIEQRPEFELIFDEKKHNIFNYVNNIDKHIEKCEGYKHYGYLPMKIAAVIQFAASIFPMPKNYHMALSGGPSTGKTVFCQYWSAALYGNRLLDIANVSDISIPALRGSVENITLFNQNIKQTTDGHLNTNDMIIINELSSDQNMKQALKGHLFSPEYKFAKVGANNETITRNAQMMITENINPEHTGKYRNTVKKYYSANALSTDDNKFSIKDAWNEDWDLELPLSHEYYDDKEYLVSVIKEIRQKFMNEHKNWIDGDEIASDDRFLFYFFINNTKESEELDDCLIHNNIHANSDNRTSRLIRSLFTKSFSKQIESCKESFNTAVPNSIEYNKKLNKLLKTYYSKPTERTKIMYFGVLKVLRALNKRNKFIQEDLDIVQYLLENTKSKIEIVDTNIFKIRGIKSN